jgi:hypothetical protein
LSLAVSWSNALTIAAIDPIASPVRLSRQEISAVLASVKSRGGLGQGLDRNLRKLGDS